MAITNKCRKFESHRQCDVAQNRFYTGNSGVPTLLNNCLHDVKPQIKQMNCAYVNDICVAFLEQVFDMQHSTFNIEYQNDQEQSAQSSHCLHKVVVGD